MTSDLYKQFGRMWTTVFVVYALLLGSLLPVMAANQPSRTGFVVCSISGGDDPSAPHGAADHEAMCCVLCQLPALPAGPLADTFLEPPRGDVVAALAVLPVRSDSRAPPGIAPQSPRGPPHHS